MSESKFVETFKTSGGKHCITNSLKQIFEFYGKPLTESMLFGLGEGLSFMYINLSDSPMISGRVKPFMFEEILAKNLNIQIKLKTAKDKEKVHHKTIKLLDEDRPVMVYADMAYLEYLEMDGHFGGHSIVIIGYDMNKKKYFVSDRDNSDCIVKTQSSFISKDYHEVSFESMMKARSSSFRPFPANNKWVEFDFENYVGVTSDVLKKAILNNCKNMLEPETKMLGIKGIDKFSKEVLKWTKFPTEKLKLAGITNYFMINKDGGTGGGAFRRMFGEFLIESSKIINIGELSAIGETFIQISTKWDLVADLLMKLYDTGSSELLNEISLEVKELYKQEYNEYLRVQATLR